MSTKTIHKTAEHIACRRSITWKIRKVGLICAIWPIVLCSTTIFFGAIADKIGHGRALKIGLFFQVTAFILMSYSISVTQFITAQVLFGLGKSFFDSSIKAIFAFSFPHDRLPFFFRMRYLLNNAGCIIGPIVGVVLYESIGKHTFLVSSALYATFLLLFSFMNPVFTRSNYAKESIDGSVSKYQSIKMLQDKNLLVWILSSFVILFVFGAYESMMPLVLSDESSFIKFGYLVSLNGFTVVLVQVFWHSQFPYLVNTNSYWAHFCFPWEKRYFSLKWKSS